VNQRLTYKKLKEDVKKPKTAQKPRVVAATKSLKILSREEDGVFGDDPSPPKEAKQVKKKKGKRDLEIFSGQNFIHADGDPKVGIAYLDF